MTIRRMGAIGIEISGGGKRRTTATAIAKERLVVAMRHYRALERNWQAWLAGNPLSIEVTASPLMGTVESVVRFSSPLDQSLASHAKACMGEVRAALDNMIVAMVAEAGGSETQASFPITAREEGWGRTAKRRMPGLAEDVRTRARALQSWAMDTPAGTQHPLVFLRQWDADKHREPMRVGVGTNFPPGESHVGEVTMTFNGPGAHEAARRATENIDVDAMFDLTVGVVRDGQVLSRTKLPPGAVVGKAHTDGSFCLMALTDGISKPDPLFPQLMNLMRFADQAADYVTGVQPDVPKAWEPGEGIGGLPTLTP